MGAVYIRQLHAANFCNVKSFTSKKMSTAERPFLLAIIIWVGCGHVSTRVACSTGMNLHSLTTALTRFMQVYSFLRMAVFFFPKSLHVLPRSLYFFSAVSVFCFLFFSPFSHFTASRYSPNSAMVIPQLIICEISLNLY